MRVFRFLLVLALCVSVPVSGWASVAAGLACPEAAAMAHGHTHGHGQAAAQHAEHAIGVAEASHQHAGGDVCDGKPCPDQHCGCGCGVGACASAGLPLLAALPATFAARTLMQHLPSRDGPAASDALTGSLLRPPIA